VADPAPTAQRVLDAAVEVIDHHGEVGIRVQDLAHGVGISVTSIYRLFDSRDGLIEAAQAERYVRSLMSDLQRFSVAAEACRSFDDVVRLVDETLDEYLTERFAPDRMTRANVLGSAQSRPRLAEALAAAQHRFDQGLVAALEPLQRSGWIRTDLDLASLAPWLAGIVLSRLLIEIGPSGADGQRWNDYTREAVLSVLRP
jgi:AcrR family transcriptional regulator